jgi:ferredoxin-like protein FixX
MNAALRAEKLLSAHGLISRGVVNFDSDGPLLQSGKRATSVMLIGHGGGEFWEHFQSASRVQKTSSANPLDDWSKQIITPIAAALGGYAVFPSDAPYYPFQQWAMRAEGVKPSPLGILIHPVFGLWHAYRGAILFENLTLSQPLQKLSHPCDTCIEKPCLSACPVSVFSESSYDVMSCRSHIAIDENQTCMTHGCLARRACPVGCEYMYSPEQMQFHMRAFQK